MFQQEKQVLMDIERNDVVQAADPGGDQAPPPARRAKKPKRTKSAKSERPHKTPAWKRLEEMEEERQLRRELSYFPEDL